MKRRSHLPNNKMLKKTKKGTPRVKDAKASTQNKKRNKVRQET